MAKKPLKRISPSNIIIFKIKNRSGFAAICMKNLTEGRTPAQAVNRLANPLKRMGLELKEGIPKPRW